MKNLNLFILSFLLTISFSALTSGWTKDFSEDFSGGPKTIQEWKSGSHVDGQKPNWVVEKDTPTAFVLRKKGSALYAFMVNPEGHAKNGTIESRFNIEKGSEAPEAGLVWRFINSKNYYYARASSLEKNVVIYKVVEGKLEEIKAVKATVMPEYWNSLKVVFKDALIEVSLNSKELISIKDKAILMPGGVGVWSTADTQAAFDDFSFQERK